MESNLAQACPPLTYAMRPRILFLGASQLQAALILAHPCATIGQGKPATLSPIATLLTQVVAQFLSQSSSFSRPGECLHFPLVLPLPQTSISYQPATLDLVLPGATRLSVRAGRCDSGCLFHLVWICQLDVCPCKPLANFEAFNWQRRKTACQTI